MTNKIDQSDLILSLLKKIQKSGSFKSAVKLQQFLGHVVEKYCEGRAGELKQYTIGVEALSLGEDFDPSQDAIIRITAGKVRRRLTEYYSSEGANDDIIIEIPKGSYVPSITNKSDNVDVAAQQSKTNLETEAKRLKLAVVPFNNISGDSELNYFADGLAEEISSALLLFKDISIVPPIATRHLAGQRLNLMEIAKQFEVRYVLDASIRKANDKVRIILQLSDTDDFNLLWSGTYDIDFEVENLINVQDEIAANVTNSIGNEYGGIIPRKITSESITKERFALTTYDAVLHMHHYNLVTSAHIYESTLEAVTLAIDKDPHNPMLLSVLAELKIDGYSFNWAEISDLPVVECKELINNALTHDKDCAYAYYVWGLLETNRRRKKELLVVVDHLMGFKQSVTSLAQAGWFLAIAGEYEEGLKLLDKQREKLQYYPGWFHHVYFLHHYENRRYDEALASANKFKMPGLLWDPLDRAAALVQLDRIEESKKTIHELLTVCPGFFDDPKRYLNCYLMRDDLVDHVLNGLAIAERR